MLLLSGGIDSPVAGYMIAKRGVKIDAVYFHAPPYTSERAKQKVVDLAKLVARYSGPINLYVVNFTDIQLYIYDQCPHDELTIIMRRYMMKIAERIGKEQGMPGTDHRREHRTGGKPDRTESCGNERSVHDAGIPSGDRI